jgi:hypothetical protein
MNLETDLKEPLIPISNAPQNNDNDSGDSSESYDSEEEELIKQIKRHQPLKTLESSPKITPTLQSKYEYDWQVYQTETQS